MTPSITKSSRKRQNDDTRTQRVVRRKSEKTLRREKEREDFLGGRHEGMTDGDAIDPGLPRSDAPAHSVAGEKNFFRTPLRRNLAQVADDDDSSPEPTSEPSDDESEGDGQRSVRSRSRKSPSISRWRRARSESRAFSVRDV